jgi:alpha-L-fucosidase
MKLYLIFTTLFLILFISVFWVLNTETKVTKSPGENRDKEKASIHDESIDTQDLSGNRLAWFKEAKLGLFIHWGPAAVLGGYWQGKRNSAEWIQLTANIPNADYEKVAAKLNPIEFDAKKWVSIAKRAGMKYITITAKHHDGFSMYDSKMTDYDIIDWTPFGRDPMKELAVACAEEGLRLCFYYSITDWHHSEYAATYSQKTKRFPDGWHGDPNREGDVRKYAAYMKGQLRELLTNYGPIGTIWFDTGGGFQGDDIVGLLDVPDIFEMMQSLQPECLFNDRFGDYGADFGTAEQVLGSSGETRYVESCMTIGENWGYHRDDINIKDARTVIHNLAKTASKGGNYLLNVGPDANGLIGEKEKTTLKELGKWLEINGESIYGTDAVHGPYHYWDGVITGRPGKLYLHVLNWPADGYVFWNGFSVDYELKKAYFLADNSQEPIDAEVYRRTIRIPVSGEAPDPYNTVIVLEVKKKN